MITFPKVFFAVLLFTLVSCTGGQNSRQFITGDLVIFHAGSLSVPVKEIAGAFKKLNPGVNVLLESAGSVESARKITDLGRKCDILASADYKVIDQMLIPGHADWNIQFASNEMCIVFTDRSKFAEVINTGNWCDILAKPDVIYGRADPDSDPCGYRSVMTLQLSEKYYKKPGFAGRLAAKNLNFMRPKEVDLIALLETRSVDYIFLYKSVAIQHGLRYLELPREVNLADPGFANFYSTASVPINGKEPGQKVIMRGEPMIYGVTILRNAPNRTAALAFLEFMLAKDNGMKILERNGQPSVIPRQNPRYDQIPASLKQYAIR